MQTQTTKQKSILYAFVVFVICEIVKYAFKTGPN